MGKLSIKWRAKITKPERIRAKVETALSSSNVCALYQAAFLSIAVTFSVETHSVWVSLDGSLQT